MFTIYSKPQCTYCNQAKALLKSKGLAYRELMLDLGQAKVPGVEYVPLSELEKYVPGVKTVPQIFSSTEGNMRLIGGFHELQKHLEKS